MSLTTSIRSIQGHCPSQLEYAAPVWDPHTQDIHKTEMVQRRAARWVLGDYSPYLRVCLENLAGAPLSCGVLNLDLSCFIRLSIDMLLYHSRRMSFSSPVPLELPIHWLRNSSFPGLIIINILFTYLHLFSGRTSHLLLPP